MSKNIYKNTEDIYRFLKSQQASPRLIRHHQLVVEAAEEILAGLKNSFPGLDCDYQQVLLGSAIHDAGKIIFPHEINSPGKNHELEGEKYLIKLGIPLDIARFSRTHAYWNDSASTIEDLLVALADTLWKGCRKEQLEQKIVTKISSSIQKDFWDIFIIADSLFEKISDCEASRRHRSTGRLNRSW